MANCRDVEQNLAAYVDGEPGTIDRTAVARHLQACPPCRAREASERAAHDILCARRSGLRPCAPESLRMRCAAQRRPGAATKHFVRRPLVSFAFAASLVLAAGLFLLFGWGTSVETYAAQIAADHLKCFQFPPSSTIGDVAALSQAWQASNGWPLRAAPAARDQRLELVGMRRCGSTKGRVAHVLYRWRGEPLSLYVLNDRLDRGDAPRAEAQGFESITKFGERAVIWYDRGQTYAIVGRGQPPELLQLAGYVRRAIE